MGCGASAGAPPPPPLQRRQSSASKAADAELAEVGSLPSVDSGGESANESPTLMAIKKGYIRIRSRILHGITDAVDQFDPSAEPATEISDRTRNALRGWIDAHLAACSVVMTGCGEVTSSINEGSYSMPSKLRSTTSVDSQIEGTAIKTESEVPSISPRSRSTLSWCDSGLTIEAVKHLSTMSKEGNIAEKEEPARSPVDSIRHSSSYQIRSRGGVQASRDGPEATDVMLFDPTPIT